MRIDCRHGYFTFEEHSAGELSRFASKFGLSLVSIASGIYTFEGLEAAPGFSFPGIPFLGADVTTLYEGEPWEIMRENELVWNFLDDEIQDIGSITQRLSIKEAANYFVSDGLILPGSLAVGAKRVTDFSAWYVWGSSKFRYTEVTYVEAF